MPESHSIYSQAQTAINLLERLSADSKWAHRGSGFRGALLRELNLASEVAGETDDPEYLNRLQALVDASFDLLEKAAIDLID